ncbi:hypothetical protein R6Z07F_010137 [Ovis aries]
MILFNLLETQLTRVHRYVQTSRLINVDLPADRCRKDRVPLMEEKLNWEQTSFQEMIKKASLYRHPLANHLMDPEVQKDSGEDDDDGTVVAEIMRRCFVPAFVTTIPWEGFHFAGHEIRINEATDCYGAVVWPSALVLCYFLETNVKQYNLVDKNVIEIGAGTGLVSIVASLLGAHVTATDLPELLGNLQYNISRNTKMKAKYLPQVKELSWGVALDENFPRASTNFDYILAADVVYAHPFLEELLITFDHLCKETTIILWVMKFRLEKENKFVDRFEQLFDLEEISSFPSLNIKLYKAMKKNQKNACYPQRRMWKAKAISGRLLL